MFRPSCHFLSSALSSRPACYRNSGGTAMMTAASDGGDGGLSRGAWAGRIVGAAVAGVAVAAQVGGTANERSNRRHGVIPSHSGI